VAQQLTNGFGVSISAAILNLVTVSGEHVSVGDFRVAFWMMAGMSLVSVPMFLKLTAEDGNQVSGRRLRRPLTP
jgi:hypothetical protein